MNIWPWLVDTLRAYPELALFLALAIGFWIGPKKLAGFSLGNVTATLLAAVAIGQLGIQVPGPIKSTFFLLFLFAVGYGVGPQFFQGLSKDGPKQILFSLVVLALCLLTPYLCALRGRSRSRLCGGSLRRFTDDLGIDRRGDGPDQSAGTVHPSRRRRTWMRYRSVTQSPTFSARSGRRSFLPSSGRSSLASILRRPAPSTRSRWAAGRKASIQACSRPTVRSPSAPTVSMRRAASRGSRSASCFQASGSSSNGSIEANSSLEADADSTLEPGDVVAISGPRSALVEKVATVVEEVDDRALLDMPVTAGGRVRAQQGGERAHDPPARGRAVHTRHLSAEDHAQHDRDTGAAGNRDPAR